MTRTPLALLALTALLAAPTAFADHNSPFGDDWANMPTDNHDEAVESVDSDMMENAAVDTSEARSEMVEDAAAGRSEMESMGDEARGMAMGNRP